MQSDQESLETIPGEDRGSRRLREATRYVSRGWLPIAAGTHKKILDKINAKSSIKLSDLSNELKSDFSLFAHCLRKIGSLPDNASSLENPIALLRSANQAQLKEMFTFPQSETPPHDLSCAKDVQLSRMRHSIIACGTVEVLATRTNIDPEFAFLCALVRQLGHLLVSWNYPSSCVRAKVGMENSGKSYDEELRTVLGFAPHRLGIEAAVGWSLNPDLLVGIGLGSEKAAPSFVKVGGEFDGSIITRYCQIGENLARANEPEIYGASAAQDWKGSGEELTRVLGPKGMELIRSRMEELFPQYMHLAPNLFPSDLSPDKAAKKINVIYSKRLLEENKYVQRCPAEVKDLYTEVYNKVVQQEPSMDAVNTLVSKVIPASGFVSGCVYFLESTKMMLIPRLKIGDKNRTFKAISCSCGGEKSHPVAEAFHCLTPLKEENVVLNGEVVSHVTGKFGSVDKIGVLFLEFTDTTPVTLDTGQRLLYFKAIRQALNDALNLR